MPPLVVKMDLVQRVCSVPNRYTIVVIYSCLCDTTMSPPLFIFETVLPNGNRTRGTAGLPYNDMDRLKPYYDGVVIVKAPAGTSRLNIVLPVVEAVGYNPHNAYTNVCLSRSRCNR